MMQISSTLPSQNLHNIIQSRTSSINTYRASPSPLNPASTQQKKASNSISLRAIACLSSSSTEIARATISNLEKLLQKKKQVDLLDPQPVGIERHNQDQQQQLENVPSSSDDQKTRKVEGLTLARLWSGIKEAAEEMSPRQFKRLRRLFSKSQEYSPKNNLSQKWRDYHGSNNWEGLLDPLDENLRREIVRFGEFVQSSYQAFHSNPAMSTEAAPAHRHVALSERSYRVTKSLYATSSVGLPKWVDDVAPDLGWMTQRSSWIGYVAVCDDRREIQRMGRRDIIIALRGTSTCMEWAENMRNVLVPLQDETASSQAQPKVECGFLSLYKTRGAHVPSLAESVVEEIKRLMEEYKGEELSITITGHSLGAALSLLVADEVSACAEEMPPIAVFSFGGPRVGNRGFAERLESRNVKVLRIVNSQDLITKVPGMFIVSDEIDKRLYENSLAAKMLNEIAYAHVGVELKVDTKMSPYLKPDADIACCHDLEAYLHLVDGFIASNCPFRANAKRSLAKLLHEQGSNVKMLYTKKAKVLKSLNVERKEQLAISGYMPSPST